MVFLPISHRNMGKITKILHATFLFEIPVFFPTLYEKAWISKEISSNISQMVWWTIQHWFKWWLCAIHCWYSSVLHVCKKYLIISDIYLSVSLQIWHWQSNIWNQGNTPVLWSTSADVCKKNTSDLLNYLSMTNPFSDTCCSLRNYL